MQETVSAFDAFNDGRTAVVLVDGDGAIISCNPMMTQLVGEEAEDISGKQCKDLLNCENSATHCCILDKISHTRQKEHTFCRFKDQWVETILDPLFNSDGNSEGGVISMSLVNEPSEAMNKLIKTQKCESIAMVAMGIAHDFNNMFSVIDAHTCLLNKSLNGNKDVHASLKAMQDVIARAKELAGQLLNVGKPAELSEKPIQLQKHIEDSVKLSMAGSTSKLLMQVPANLWPVHANTDQIKQLVCNLTMNARQSIDNGCGVVEVLAENITARKAENLKLKPAKYIRITFKDNGHGIEKEHINSIFHPYYTTREEGTGLGLPTVSYIAAQHKGYVNVQSTPGKSTTFSVYLNAED